MKSEGNKVLFIVNKFSGKGFRAGTPDKIASAARLHNLESTIVFTEARGHATQLARRAVIDKNYAMVVAMGGDGTINEVANGLLHSEIPMGIIPKGSGNGLARHLGIPMQVDAALKSLFDSKPIPIDTFELNGRLSVNVSGIGFDGHVSNLFAARKKRGLHGYTSVTINEFFRYGEFKALIKTADKTDERSGFIIAIANSSQYGNNARIAPNASVCDGVLQVCFVRKIPPYRLDFVYSFFTGNIEATGFCEILEATEMTISVDKPTAFHIDGESGGVADTFTIRIVPKSLRVFVPATSVKF